MYFGAIGLFYLDFSQVSDAEVTAILNRTSPQDALEKRD
jgi:predicted phosphoribosyltransferase